MRKRTAAERDCATAERRLGHLRLAIDDQAIVAARRQHAFDETPRRAYTGRDKFARG